MKTCKKCGHNFAGTRCSPCQKAYAVANADRLKAYRQTRAKEISARSLAWQKANPAKANASSAAWKAANPEKAKAYVMQYYEENKEARSVAFSSYREANLPILSARLAVWKKANADKCNASNSARRAAKLSATPVWADLVEIDKMYALATAMTKSSGVYWHVDHIVPLRSDLVCGLHVHHNMQVFLGADNCSKGNRHWPDMPD
jgi:hypothetical protein